MTKMNTWGLLSFPKAADSTTHLEDSLIKAAKEGSLSLVEDLLKMGVNSDAKEKDEYKWTPLMWACNKGHEDVVDCLLKYGADVNIQDFLNWSSLILASRNGHAGIVQKLLDKGAKVNSIMETYSTSLLWAAQEGHVAVARVLLENRAETEVQDYDGFSPLLQASQDGHLDIVEMLLKYNPQLNINQTTNDDWSALMLATKNGHEAIVRYLVEHGSNVSYKKKDGTTALHIASYNGHDAIVEYLCSTGKVNVNLQDRFGMTPLMFAVKRQKLKVVKTLVGKAFADVNVAENKFKWTAIYFSIWMKEALQYLFRSGRVNLSHKDVMGNTIMDVCHICTPWSGLVMQYHDHTIQL